MRTWSGVGAAYAASYAALCAGTADAIASGLSHVRSLGPHDREPRDVGALLDVGSGTGALAAKLSDAGWAVTGCEPEPTMREVAVAQHPDIHFVAGALPALPFPDSTFDAATANFVLNHVPDPRAAAAEMARVSTRGAALVATIWTVSPSWFWLEICERAGLVPATAERLPAEKDFERTASGFGRMLDEGGWRVADVTELDWTWHAPRDALWTSAEGGVASAGAFYLALGDEDRGRFRRAFDDVCDERTVGGVPSRWITLRRWPSAGPGDRRPPA